MSDLQISSVIRRVVEVSIGLWSTVIFQGGVVGSAILFVSYLFTPYLTRNYNDVINLNIPEWLYFMLGIALVLLVKALFGHPLLRDNNREQLETIEAITRKLPKLEQTKVYRGLATKMVDEFQVDSELKIDLVSESKKIVEEEKE